MLRPALEKYFHPFVGKILFWNAVMLIVIKLVLPQSAFQLASFLETLPVFDSREIVKATNETRVLNNLSMLSVNPKLDVAASEKLTDMAVNEYFAHVSPTGVTPWYWIKKADYSYSSAGENLAIGFFTAQDTLKAWLESPSHKENILNSKYKEIGVAARGVKIGNREGILVVQMFGTPSGGQLSAVIPDSSLSTKITPTPAPVTSGPIAQTSPLIQEVESAESAVEYFPTQQISTEAEVSIQSPTEPIPVKFEDADGIRKISDSVNNLFSVYALIVTVLSVFAFFMFERSNRMAMRVAFNFAVFTLSIIIPSLGLSFQGWIF